MLTSDKEKSTTDELKFLSLNLEPDIEDLNDFLAQPTEDETRASIYAIRPASRPLLISASIQDSRKWGLLICFSR